jgi:hypothetical protein
MIKTIYHTMIIAVAAACLGRVAAQDPPNANRVQPRTTVTVKDLTDEFDPATRTIRKIETSLHQ